MTLYGGLLFVNEDARGSPVIDLMAFILIIIVNFRFFALWTYMMVLTQKKYKFFRTYVIHSELVLSYYLRFTFFHLVIISSICYLID